MLSNTNIKNKYEPVSSSTQKNTTRSTAKHPSEMTDAEYEEYRAYRQAYWNNF